jgi:hypothetical protein
MGNLLLVLVELLKKRKSRKGKKGEKRGGRKGGEKREKLMLYKGLISIFCFYAQVVLLPTKLFVRGIRLFVKQVLKLIAPSTKMFTTTKTQMM